MSSNDPHMHAFVFQHPSPFFILKSIFFSLVSKLSLKERRRKIVNDRVLMIEDMINLQNKAMKTNVKVKFLYSFTHAQGMLQFFSRKKTPTNLWNCIHFIGAILVVVVMMLHWQSKVKIRHQISAVGEILLTALRAAAVSCPGVLLSWGCLAGDCAMCLSPALWQI